MDVMDELYRIFSNSDGVSIDTRTLRSNQIFFAIKGDNFDGHSFVSDAISAGARLVVIDNPEYDSIPNTLLVDNVIQSLQALATLHRSHYDGPLLAITGSNGKTTTKELMATSLSKKYKVLATKGNLNNHLGVPLTLLSINAAHDFVIIEMGANRPGDIQELCHIARPEYGLITNIGYAHIEGFGSLEGVKQTKSELYRYIRANGTLIFVDQDDHNLASVLPKEVDICNYDVDDIEFLYGGTTLSFEDTETEEIYKTNMYGIYNQQNIEAAITVARYFKVLDEDIFDAISEYKPKMNRSQIERKGQLSLIMDAYNANPSSMKLSIKSFMNMDAPQKSLILGDMKELGPDAKNKHQEIIDYLASGKWENVILIGSIFSELEIPKDYLSCLSVDQFIDNHLNIFTAEPHTILLKGSRSIRLEKILEVL